MSKKYEIIKALIADGLITQDQRFKVGAVIDKVFEGEISLSWSVDDIQSWADGMNVELTDDEAGEILFNVERGHDSDIGINWDVIGTHISMYKADPNRANGA